MNYYSLGVLGAAEAHAHRTAAAQYQWCRGSGRLISIAEAKRTPGAWLFIEKNGAIDHVATSVGANDIDVEEANPRDDCILGHVGNRFDHAGLCPSLEFPSVVAPAKPANAPAPTGPTLIDVIRLCRLHAQIRPFQIGDGKANQLDAGVRLIQHALLYSGITWDEPHRSGLAQNSGEYDNITSDAVKWFQKLHSLAPWGAVNQVTWNIMYPQM